MFSDSNLTLVQLVTQIDLLRDLEEFLNQGGMVLVVIMFTTFGLCVLVLERFHYFWRRNPKELRHAVAGWQRRTDRQSWYAQQIRKRIISIIKIRSEHNLITIKTAILIAPLLGLLGTVTGMIDVFDAMAFSGSSNTRAMAAGVSRATIPTMAGMVVALVGMLCNLRLQRSFNDSVEFATTQIALEDKPTEPAARKIANEK